MESTEEETRYSYLVTYYQEKWTEIKPLLESIQTSTLDVIVSTMEKIFYEMEIKDSPHQDKFYEFKGIRCLILKQCSSDPNQKINTRTKIPIDLTTLNQEKVDEFTSIIRKAAELALRIDVLFPAQKLEVMVQDKSADQKYTSEQVACVIAHGFFCIIPQQDPNLDMPSLINFTTWNCVHDEMYYQKLLFYFQYFRALIAEEAEGLVRYLTFERKSLTKEEYSKLNSEFWLNSEKPLKSVEIRPKGCIEENEGTLMVDFANMYIGGGCMGSGCVQEEILFLLLFSLMLFPPMRDNESIIIAGAKRYSNSTGYAWSLKFLNEHEDTQELDSLSRIKRVFTAIDATYLFNEIEKVKQFTERLTLRELNKASIGFAGDKNESQDTTLKMDVSTGKWGCGAFNGNPEYKFLIQWIATSYNSRNMSFYTFDTKDCSNLEYLYNKYSGKLIKDLYSDILEFSQYISKKCENIDELDYGTILYDNTDSISKYLSNRE